MDKDAILMQNARFYEAFEHADLPAVERIWSHAPHVRCIHPGWEVLEGWDAVRDSWQNIFKAGGGMRISLRNVSAEVHGNIGVVTLREEITYQASSAVRTASVIATNIFHYDSGEWKMIHHHGSAMVIAEADAPDDSYRYN